MNSQRAVMAAAAALTLFSVPLAAPAAPAGWRTDGTGRYPDATPPMEWATNKNVRWATPLAAWGNATPVIAGKKLFITAEPHTLLCLDADTGEILWTASNHAYEAIYTPEEAARAKEAEAEAKKIAAEVADLTRQQTEAQKEFKANTNDAALKAKIEELGKKIKERNDHSAKTFQPHFAPPAKHGICGWATPTPVTDGKNVWVLFGNGVAACYDLDGKRLWAVITEKQKDTQGQSTSPALVGDKLVIYVNNLFALDKATGKEAWRVPCDYGHVFGSIVPARVGGADAAVAPGGEIVRAGDGKVLARAKGAPFNAPAADGGAVYFADQNVWAVRIADKIENDAVAVTQIWKTATSGARHYPSPLVHEGIVYDMNEGSELAALSAADGKLLYKQKLEIKGTTAYPSLVLAGKALLASAENGTTVIVQPGAEFKELGRNTLEPFRATPVPQGKRLYIRAMKRMYCLEQP